MSAHRQRDRSATVPIGLTGQLTDPSSDGRDYRSQAGQCQATVNGRCVREGRHAPTLLKDFHHLREKITHFNHERIPEQVVHARGHRRARSGHLLRHRGLGIRAGFLAYGATIPVFRGLSTVLSSRWPAGSVRDIRRLAVEFYTCDATFDLAYN